MLGATFLVSPHEVGFCEDVPAHGLFKVRLRDHAEVGENRIECIKLVKVAVSTFRWDRAAIALPLPIVEPLRCPSRQVLWPYGPWQCGRRWRDIIKHPMNPGHTGILWIRGIGVIDDKRKAFRALRQAHPGEWQRNIIAIACIAHGYFLTCIKCGRKNGEWHFQSYILGIADSIGR